METKLSEINTQYHTFEDNQVLTATQLNDFLDYFEDQDRLSRILLSGVGIVCGFSVKLNSTKAKTTVTISQGAGVTTDGDLIQLKKDIPRSLAKSADLKQVVFTHFKKFDDSVAGYSFFRKKIAGSVKKEAKPIEMWELLPKSEEGATLLQKLSEIENKVALLYLENYANKGDLCTSIDCDNQGVEQVARLRVLLVSESDAESIASLDSIFSKHNITEKYVRLPAVETPRVFLSPVNAQVLSSIKQSFLNAFSANSTLANLKAGYHAIFSLFDKPAIDSQIGSLFNFNLSNMPADFQYRYDLLNDLIETYNEIKQLLLHIKVECCPAIGAFPKHLLLGKLVETEKYQTLRHLFYSSPVTKTELGNYKKIMRLMQRAAAMVNHYNSQLAQDGVKITPSQTTGLLGERAIPVYYQVNHEILENWCYIKTENLQQQFNLSYHIQNLAPVESVKNPLSFRLEKYNFFRIEGLIGANTKTSLNKIVQLRSSYRLDFDLVSVDVSQASEYQKILLKFHPMEHRAGVPKGGTFIVLSDKNTIVADFSVSYRIPGEAEFNCCPVRECTFPWISTLKYMNNLARSLKGTQSRNKLMPRNYILQVIEYRINNHSLVNQPLILSVPLSQIFLRRMHAVTDALNHAFPEGVVFDFNESQKRFVITYGKNDQFLVRLRDATQNLNNPVYTYSNNGMFRDNKLLRSNAMICRDILQYNRNFYRKLQTDFAPVNKDDDYGTYNDKWELWNTLIRKLKKSNPGRVIRKTGDLPTEILSLITKLKRDVSTVDKNCKLSLDGDWVNAAWVDNAMLDYYRKNKANSNDPVVQFIRLRKQLHNETGITKLSVYITNKVYTADFDQLIKDYAASADFYFTVPKGINAIEL